jgi:restriction system protein
MAILSGIAEIKCEKCGKTFSIDAADLDIDQVGADERQMGAEIFYAGKVELQCPKCRNAIQVSYEASEYPVGVPNYSGIHAHGARIIQGFADIDVHFEDEIYLLEEESKLYAPDERRIIANLCSGVFELITAANNNPAIIYDIDPRKFEELIAHIFSLQGFHVQLTKQTRDGGRDIIAIRSDLGIPSKYIIECKRYAFNNPVGVELVRALYGVQTQEGANKAVLATTSRFTSDARSFATVENTTKWFMNLKDFEDIRQWVNVAATANKSFKGTR